MGIVAQLFATAAIVIGTVALFFVIGAILHDRSIKRERNNNNKNK